MTQWPSGKGICIIADGSCSRGRARDARSSQSPPARQGPGVLSLCQPVVKLQEAGHSPGGRISPMEVYEHCKSGLLLFGELVSQHTTSEEVGRFEEISGTREPQGVRHPGGWPRWAGAGQGGLCQHQK